MRLPYVDNNFNVDEQFLQIYMCLCARARVCVCVCERMVHICNEAVGCLCVSVKRRLSDDSILLPHVLCAPLKTAMVKG
jgi:hypothetical protein